MTPQSPAGGQGASERTPEASVARLPLHYEGALPPSTGCKTDHEVRLSSIVVQYTELLRTSDYDLWSRLRELLKGQGLDPDRTVVVDLLQEGPDPSDKEVVGSNPMQSPVIRALSDFRFAR
ncbi:hypothetical protein [Streptomyces flavidovirens]|uniref:hypothetical protein n=1 Tax=Streptomyces flavidovirens TaxID=67298 RepID=UPI0036B836EA